MSNLFLLFIPDSKSGLDYAYLHIFHKEKDYYNCINYFNWPTLLCDMLYYINAPQMHPVALLTLISIARATDIGHYEGIDLLTHQYFVLDVIKFSSTSAFSRHPIIMFIKDSNEEFIDKNHFIFCTMYVHTPHLLII